MKFKVRKIFQATDFFKIAFTQFFNIQNSEKKLRVIFMGTPDIAVPFLEELAQKEKVIAVFTAPDLPAGRGMKIKESSVKILAKKYNLRVLQPNSLNEEQIFKQIKNLNPDLIICVAFGYKIPENIINLPIYNSINIHFSLLPKYRGAAPINWAIIKGDKETGVTSFYLAKKMDAGDIIDQIKVEIKDTDDADSLAKKLTEAGVALLNSTLDKIKNKTVLPIPQESNFSIAPKLKKIDGKIDWNMTSLKIYDKMRGLVSWPGGHTFIDTADSKRLVKLFEPKLQFIEEEGSMPGEILNICKDRGILIKCGHGAIWIKKVQLEGHKKVSGYEFYLGRKIQKGDIFES